MLKFFYGAQIQHRGFCFTFERIDIPSKSVVLSCFNTISKVPISIINSIFISKFKRVQAQGIFIYRSLDGSFKSLTNKGNFVSFFNPERELFIFPCLPQCRTFLFKIESSRDKVILRPELPFCDNIRFIPSPLPLKKCAPKPIKMPNDYICNAGWCEFCRGKLKISIDKKCVKDVVIENFDKSKRSLRESTRYEDFCFAKLLHFEHFSGVVKKVDLAKY